MKSCRLIAQCLAALLLIISPLAAAPAMAQTVTGEIRGTVRDSSGGVLPGVTVTATHTQTGLPRTETTSDTGSYVFPSLPIGTYIVSAELQGFRKAEKTGFELALTAASPPTSRCRSAR